MPSTVTHTYFIMDIFDKLPLERKKFLKEQKEKMRVFAQSTDPFNFYFSLNLKKAAKIRRFADHSHTYKTGELLVTLTNYIKYNYLYQKPEVIAYLYGMISHYILDCTLHPYIYYKTGEFNKTNKLTYKYNSKHHEMETTIDKYMIKIREGIIPYKYKHYNKCIKPFRFSKDLIEVINFCYKETYNIKNMHKFYYNSIKDMYLAFKLLRYDPHGIKEKIYKLTDIVTPKNFIKITFLSYHYYPINYNQYLNTNHNKWYYPTSKTQKYSYSFIDLYIKALNKAIKTIKEVDSYIYDNKKINLNKLYQNLSYKTGTDINKKQELKFFEF